MKIILLLYFMHGSEVLNVEVVKQFETLEECQALIESENFRTLEEYKKEPATEHEIVLTCVQNESN